MVRGTYAVVRVAVIVRIAARRVGWLGAVAAVAGAFVPGLTGRRIGVLAGAALFVIAAAAAFQARRGRYRSLACAASRAGKSVFLQDSAVTARLWTRSRKWWLLAAFVAAVASSLLLPAAGGMALAGLGAGLWAKAVALGRWEREADALLWVRADSAGRGPAGDAVVGFELTGVAAGDAVPGGARRRRAVRVAGA